MSSTTQYITRSKTDREAIVEVTFDRDDGAVERVSLYCEVSDSWLPINGDLPPSLEARVHEFIADWLDRNREVAS